MADTKLNKQEPGPVKKALLPKKKNNFQALCPRLSRIEDLKFACTDVDFVFGLDEVGVACLAGPVVAACFAYAPGQAFLEGEISSLVRDSKQLKLAQRLEAEKYLLSRDDVFYATAEATVEEIDKINIFWATRLAMKRAFEKVLAQVEGRNIDFQRAALLVDGHMPPKEFLELGERYLVQDLVKGDTRVFPIAAASIIAKNYRDAMMKDLGAQFPDYGWESNVGYPTLVHREALVRLGPTEHHRRSFNLDYRSSEQVGLL